MFKSIPDNIEASSIEMPRLDEVFGVLEYNLNIVMKGDSVDRHTQDWRS